MNLLKDQKSHTSVFSNDICVHDPVGKTITNKVLVYILTETSFYKIGKSGGVLCLASAILVFFESVTNNTTESL